MWIFNKLRFNLFWILDTLSGHKIKKNIDDISFILENYNSKESLNRRKKYLQDLLLHAVNNSSYYKKYKGFKSIEDFPVIDKATIREKFDAFVNTKDIESYNKVATSGSTGTPFSVYINAKKKARNTADTIYFAKKGGFNLGGKLYCIKLWGNKTIKKNIVTKMQNITMHEVSQLNDEHILSLINHIKKQNTPLSILSYASALQQICNYLERTNSKPIKGKVSSIITMSETLGNNTKELLQKYFDVQPVSRYSNVENGIFSQQIINEGHCFHINWASYYVELLDLKNNKPAKFGELGRVVITDLFNYAMPMIRYDTGDIAIMNHSEYFNRAPAFTEVVGRKMDLIYNTKGEPISPYVAYEMEHFEELKQFQLIQESVKTYRVKLNIENDFNREHQLVENLKKELGIDANIIIEYVNEIPVLNSGKRKMVINAMVSN